MSNPRPAEEGMAQMMESSHGIARDIVVALINSGKFHQNADAKKQGEWFATMLRVIQADVRKTLK